MIVTRRRMAAALAIVCFASAARAQGSPMNPERELVGMVVADVGAVTAHTVFRGSDPRTLETYLKFVGRQTTCFHFNYPTSRLKTDVAFLLRGKIIDIMYIAVFRMGIVSDVEMVVLRVVDIPCPS